MALSLEVKLMRFPPMVCYLLARKGRGGSQRHLGDEEIARLAGLSVHEVLSLSHTPSWENVSTGIMLRFSKACGVEFSNRQCLFKHAKVLKRHPNNRFRWLKRDPQYSEKFRDRIIRYKEWLIEQKKKP